MPSLGAPAPMEAGTGGLEVSSEVINHSNWRNHGNIMGTWVTIYIVVKVSQIFVQVCDIKIAAIVELCVAGLPKLARRAYRMHPSQSFHVSKFRISHQSQTYWCLVGNDPQ